MASYRVNRRALTFARQLIDAGRYVVDSDWGEVQPKAADENTFLRRHNWTDYSAWHLGLTDGAADDTKARYAFVFGDFERIHRSGIIACHYRAAEYRHKEGHRAGGAPPAAIPRQEARLSGRLIIAGHEH